MWEKERVNVQYDLGQDTEILRAGVDEICILHNWELQNITNSN